MAVPNLSQSTTTRRRRLRIGTFRLQPWRMELILLHGAGHAQLAAYVREHHAIVDYVPEATAVGHAFVYDGRPAIVWVQSIRDVPVLVHELMHVVFAVLANRGLKPVDDAEEAYTYTLECLLRQVLEHSEWELLT
jgi:hypothetical protein